MYSKIYLGIAVAVLLAAPAAFARETTISFPLDESALEAPGTSLGSHDAINVSFEDHYAKGPKDHDSWSNPYGKYTYDCLNAHLRDIASKNPAALDRIFGKIRAIKITSTGFFPDAQYDPKTHVLSVELQVSTDTDRQGHIVRGFDDDIIPSDVDGLNFCAHGMVPRADAILDEAGQISKPKVDPDADFNAHVLMLEQEAAQESSSLQTPAPAQAAVQSGGTPASDVKASVSSAATVALQAPERLTVSPAR